MNMKALVKKEAKPGAQIEEVPIPEPGPEEVVIKVMASAICGTDLQIIKWDNWSASRIKPPLIFGHEFCGEVYDIGSNVEGLNLGTYVTAEGHFNCGNCYFCKTGQGHICKHVKIAGVDTDGCFAEYVMVPKENIWRLSENISYEIGAIHDPLGNAVHATLIDDLAGKDVLITGAGSIGLAAAAVAKKVGAKQVFITEVSKNRIKLAKKMGADRVLNPNKVNVVDTIYRETEGMGADVLLEMTGQLNAIEDGFKSLRAGGWASMLGIPSDKVTFDFADGIVFKGAKVYGVNGRLIYDTWYKMDRLLKTGLDIQPIITHKFNLEDFEEVFHLAETGEAGKVILYP